MKINVQSVIDLITNSSTETFTILSDNAESLIKEVVNNILETGGSKLTFSDLFTYREEYDDRWDDEYRLFIKEYIRDEDGSDYGKSLLDIYDLAIDKLTYWEGENRKAFDFIFEEIKKIAINSGAMTYNEFCEQQNENEYDYTPALRSFHIDVKEGLDNESAKFAASALNSLELLYSADYRCG